MIVSVIEPMAPAYKRTVQILFKPWDLQKWFVIGFAAFLSQCDGELGRDATNGTRFFVNFSSGSSSGGSPGEAFAQAIDWMNRHLASVIATMVVGTLILSAIYLLARWVSCCAKFVFIDNIVTNTSQFGVPWKRYQKLGNSLFGFRLLCDFVLFNSTLLALVPGGLLFWHDISRFWPNLSDFQPGGETIGALVVTFFLEFPLWLVLMFLLQCVEQFVIPLMYHRDLRAWAAARLFYAELLRPHLGSFVLFSLWQIVIGMGTSVAVIAVFILTCCVAACVMGIPYLGTVLLLPLLVFLRTYSLLFLQQFGTQYMLVPDVGPPQSAFPVVMNPPSGAPPNFLN